MTKEEGKGQKRKKRAGNQAGNRPSAEEEESSKQFEEEKKENMQTGTANEAGRKQRLARRRKQLSYGGMKIKKEKEINRDGDRAEKKLEHKTCRAFCGLPGITDMFKRFSEEYMRKTNVESLEGMAEQEPELTENFKWLDEYFMSKFIKKWRELFRKFFEEGTTENFKAIYLKVKEEEERQERDKIIELLEILD